ncbi:very-short-patch-repair endonuclease [Nocardioides marinisabuli]|uniref:Very-short-patch-repair endonuclease n=1 Tax=Nocardioides marinisabuli TaxID=419476 RepID=A0A7Y9JP87_9ACTN|nr:type IV toxin-antitoxin system AbiEi family antitoxin domain-containing protein [Nocardioides marinisabuli]NYD56110.1 very-short-patch-repair endonuclease [Nocardioides marinisabuli]
MDVRPTPLTEPATTEQAAALGWTKRRLQRAREDGRVRRVLRGVYVDADVPDGTALRAAAARLVMPTRMVVCDRSAAWMHGVDHWEPSALDVPPHLEVVARDGTRTRLTGTRGALRSLAADDVMELDGVPVTTPLRTAADLACLRGRLGAAAVLDQFARRHGITPEDLRAITARFAGRRGVTQLRELAPSACGLLESPAESWVRRLVVDHQLPMPTPQVVVLLPEGQFRLDLAYPRLRIAIEYDGEEHHSSPEDRERDRLRREALRRAGWVVVVVRKDGLSGPGLDTWVRQLRAAVAERVGPAGRRYARGEGAGVHRR